MLQVAVQSQNIDLAKLLIDAGADVNVTMDAVSVLHLALRLGSRKLVKLLIDAGADVNAKMDNGIYPLHLAVASQNIGLTKH